LGSNPDKTPDKDPTFAIFLREIRIVPPIFGISSGDNTFDHIGNIYEQNTASEEECKEKFSSAHLN
jgi:hypothetical protein